MKSREKRLLPIVVCLGAFILLASSPAIFARTQIPEGITTQLTTSMSVHYIALSSQVYVEATGTLTYTDCVPGGCVSGQPISGATVTMTFYQFENGQYSVWGSYQVSTDSNGHYDTGWLYCGIDQPLLGYDSCYVTGEDAYFSGYLVYPAAYACSGQTPDCGLL